MKTSAIAQINHSTILLDLGLLGLACAIPAASHLFAFPLYHLDPMRILLFGAMLISAKNLASGEFVNCLIMAVLLPLTSCFVVGMPTLPKALIIGAELATNVALFYFLNTHLKIGKSKTRIFVALFLSIIGAKCVYYGLKALCIYTGILQSSIVSTPWYTQMTVLAVLAMIFALVFPKKQ